MVIAFGVKIVDNKRGSGHDIINEMIVEELKYTWPTLERGFELYESYYMWILFNKYM